MTKKRSLIRKKKDMERVDPIPVRNKYISGVCKNCGNDYTDIEDHYKKYPDHRKK